MPLTPAESNDTVRSELDVRNYYDDNTNLFLKLGLGGNTRAIHQPLFLHEGDSVAEAMHAQHRMIHEHIQSGDMPQDAHILDLGCGVGAALEYLGRRLPNESRLTGITISETQAIQANQWLLKNNITNAHVRCGSYLSLPEDLQKASLAYAIESFIHAGDASAFFSEVSDVLHDGGTLIIIDDFLTTNADHTDPYYGHFVNGWRANALHTISEVSELARSHGLTLMEATDLTKYQRLWRPRDRWVSAIQPLLPVLPLSGQYKRFLRGGNARQRLFQSVSLVYAMIVFRK